MEKNRQYERKKQDDDADICVYFLLDSKYGERRVW